VGELNFLLVKLNEWECCDSVNERGCEMENVEEVNCETGNELCDFLLLFPAPPPKTGTALAERTCDVISVVRDNAHARKSPFGNGWHCGFRPGSCQEIGPAAARVLLCFTRLDERAKTSGEVLHQRLEFRSSRYLWPLAWAP